MPSSNLPFLILLLLAFSCIHVQSHEGGYIAAEISSKGIDFFKDLLIHKVESSLVPLQLSDMERAVKIPLIGTVVHMVLSDITIESIRLGSSTVETGNSGIVLRVVDATANLSMKWKYWYRGRFIPILVSDDGSATVQVEDMEVDLTLSLKTVEGSLNINLLECECYVNDISIKLDGGASWLYQRLVDAFESKISSAIEDVISSKINNKIEKLDSSLQSLPKEVAVTNIASLNISFVDDPELSNSSINFEVNGLFFAKQEVTLSSHYHGLLKASSSCKKAEEMAKISVHEKVLKSAMSVYYKANKMRWLVDEVPDEYLLNTSGWRSIIPQLYKMYPNHAMNLNISVSSLPTIKVEEQQTMSTIPLDVVIGILDEGETIPIACISTVINSSVSVKISGNTVTENIKLNNFTMYNKWSNIGDIHMNLLQDDISTIMNTVIVPYVNMKLSKGIHIPAFHGYGLQDAHIVFADSWIVICSNVASVKQVSII